MHRRSFIKKTGMLTAAVLGMPYILPTGRLFARTQSRKIGHVVFCLLAGGIRNIESVHQAEGNLMPALLNGAGSSIPGLQPIPSSPWAQPLQQQAAYFKEMRYAEGPTGHYNGHTVAVTGQYTATGLNLKVHPEYPTIFEYYLKHNSPTQTALNAWWITNGLGPYPALNYSKYPGYGAQYGANHIAPTSLFSNETFNAIANPRQFDAQEEARIAKLQGFLNDNFKKQAGGSDTGIQNTPADNKRIQDFIQRLVQRAQQGAFSNPLGMPDALAINDTYNVLVAEEILKEFKPELLALNLQDVDIGHSNYTEYCNRLRKEDYAVAHLWKTIQSTPGLADDTVMIIVPEHGRNLQPNSIRDTYGRFALDHTNDNSSREIFCMMLGPANVIKQNQTFGTPANPVGESIDIVPTIASLLGFDADIPSGLLPGRVLSEALL